MDGFRHDGGIDRDAGDVGDRLGGPLAGEVEGMNGGMVVVRGDAGERAGDRMRRGMLIVEGDAGEAAGSRMLAGTLIVRGARRRAHRLSDAPRHDRARRAPRRSRPDIRRLRRS